MLVMDRTLTRLPVGHPAGGQFTGMKRPDAPFYLVAPLSDIETRRLSKALRNGTDANGNPLSPNSRERITALVRNPSSATWDNGHSLYISDGQTSTVWQAVIKHSDFDVTTGPGVIDGVRLPWKTIPTREQILIGLELGTKQVTR
jgi:hypothetical protein